MLNDDDAATLQELRRKIGKGEELPPQQFALYENLERQQGKVVLYKIPIYGCSFNICCCLSI
jgi:hypothetical protein